MFLCGYTWNEVTHGIGVTSLHLLKKRDGLRKAFVNYTTKVVSKDFLLFTEGIYEVKNYDRNF
jgi:hypothetical protein